MNTASVKVLLVEDDEDDVVLARQLLRDIEFTRFEIDWISDFDEALARLRDGQYDVCLVDYHLGPQNGVDFITQAVALGCTAPIILLTGMGDHSVDLTAMNAGAADFLHKRQLSASALERSIRYSIQQHRGEEQRMKLLREQAAREQAEAANRAKDQFLAVLSHELRTPLTAVLLTLGALEEETHLTPQMREMVDVIRRNADLEARLIDDLLDLTRIARGKLEIRREMIDIHEQIHFAMKDCCGQEITEKNIKIVVELEADKHHVWGDPARLQQVLWNLIKNAAKFTPELGIIAVRTSNEEGRLRISVSDNGIGIASDALPKIFNAFEQAGRAITRRFGGLGLGLAICKKLVELHGGRVWAKSEGAGKGATFMIELPAILSNLTPRGTPDVAETMPAPARNPVRVLLVEDHPDTAMAMSRLLSRRGHSVFTATKMADALKLADAHSFDILISDIGLPDGTGLELMQTLRRRTPIKGVALSGFGMEEDLERSRAAGFMEHLTKPIDFKQLDAVIARLVTQETAPVVAAT